MFFVIRLIISCVFYGCSAIVIKKSNVAYKRKLHIIAIIMSVVLISVLAFFPFENLFITFDSPKKAYEYANFGKINIELIVEGNDCSFVVDRKDDTYTHLILPKTKDGWKIGVGTYIKNTAQVFDENSLVEIYRYKNTNDYFVMVSMLEDGEAEISDSCGSKFSYVSYYNDAMDETYVTYYAHIAEYDSQYYVIVDGDKIIP